MATSSTATLRACEPWIAGYEVDCAAYSGDDRDDEDEEEDDDDDEDEDDFGGDDDDF